MSDDDVTELHSIPPDSQAKGGETETKDASDEGEDMDSEEVVKHLKEMRDQESSELKMPYSSDRRSARASRSSLEQESNPVPEGRSLMERFARSFQKSALTNSEQFDVEEEMEDQGKDEDEERKDEFEKRTAGSILAGFPFSEADNVLQTIQDARKKEEEAKRKEDAMRGRAKRGRPDNQDAEEEDDKEDEDEDRTTVYSSDVKDLVSDDHHETIEKVQAIAYVMAQAKKYLGCFNGVKMAWNKIGGTSYSENAISCLASNNAMIEEQVKYLLKDIELEIDNRAILVYLDTIRFARLKSTEAKAEFHVHKHAIEAIKACPNVTKSAFPHLHRNTEPGLSASSKESIRMCHKKSEMKILIFIVRLHYCIIVKEAFRLASKLESKQTHFDFETFPELELVLTELERDRESAITAPVKKKGRIKAESEVIVPPEVDLMGRLDALESNIIEAIDIGLENLWQKMNSGEQFK